MAKTYEVWVKEPKQTKTGFTQIAVFDNKKKAEDFLIKSGKTGYIWD